MKTKLKSILPMLGLAMLAGFTFSSCESTSGPSNTHEMGGPRTPRMDNSLMPNRGTPGTTNTGTRSDSHEMGGPRTPRMNNSTMPGRN